MVRFLSERGLELSHEKTSITHRADGFNFLGQNVRRLHDGCVLLRPAKQNVKTFLSKIRKTFDTAGAQTAGELIQRLNQQIKGWAMYHRNAASKRTFAYVDDRIYHMVRAWCRKRHPTKGGKWLKQKYFPTRDRRKWSFQGTVRRQGKEWPIQLMKAQAVPIRRHVMIRTAVNPYDPQWDGYLENRHHWRLEQTAAGRDLLWQLWRNQHGLCGHCTDTLAPDRRTWRLHYRTPRSQGGLKIAPNLELVHRHCHQQLHLGEPL